jgi:hypothetical protein
VAISHTIVLATVFFPPFVMCIAMSGPDVAYFVGRSYFAPMLVLIPLLILVPLLHLCFRPLNPFFYLGTMLIPAILFAYIGLEIHSHAGVAGEALINRDCFHYPQKLGLQRAYMSALEFYMPCKVQFPGHTSVAHCPGYDQLLRTFPKEMPYLQGLEWRFPCAGICRNADRLWSNAGAPAPTCGLFAAQWLQGAASQAWVVLLYSLIAGLLSIPAYILIAQPVIHRLGESERPRGPFAKYAEM